MTASRETTTTEPLSTRRELELLRDLQRLANERAREEQRIRTVLAEGLEAAEKARDAAAAEIERQFTEGRAAATERITSKSTGTARAALRGRSQRGPAGIQRACGRAWSRSCRA